MRLNTAHLPACLLSFYFQYDKRGRSSSASPFPLTYAVMLMTLGHTENSTTRMFTSDCIMSIQTSHAALHNELPACFLQAHRLRLWYLVIYWVFSMLGYRDGIGLSLHSNSSGAPWAMPSQNATQFRYKTYVSTIVRLWRNKVSTLICLTKVCVHQPLPKCNLLKTANMTPEDLEVISYNRRFLTNWAQWIPHFKFHVFILMVHKLCFKWMLCNVIIYSSFTRITRLNPMKSFTFCTFSLYQKTKPQ